MLNRELEPVVLSKTVTFIVVGYKFAIKINCRFDSRQHVVNNAGKTVGKVENRASGVLTIMNSLKKNVSSVNKVWPSHSSSTA